MHTHNDFPQPSSGSVWRERLLTAGAAIIFGLTLSNVAPADEVSRDKKRAADAQHDAAVSQAKADYKAARARCNELAGNDKDVCVKEAKAARDMAKADAKAAKKSTGARAEANEETREALYKADKEKCDALAGDSKDACEKRAEARYRQ